MRGLNFLIDWAGNDNCKRNLLNTVLKKEDNNIKDICDKSIKIIKEKEKVNLIIEKISENSNNKLVINEIKNINNVNAIYKDNDISLGNNLNVIYGENGSGKSSYVRMFKKLSSNYFTNKKILDLLPNIYNKNKQEHKQCFTIKYNYDQKEYEKEINLNNSDKHLSKINIFDSESVVPLINSNLTFSVLPEGLIYFNKLSLLLDKIKEEMFSRSEIKKKEKEHIFENCDKSIENDINTILNKVDKIDEIDTYFDMNYKVNKEEREKINTLKEKVDSLKSKKLSSRIEVLLSQKKVLEDIKSNINGLSDKYKPDVILNINNLINDYNKKLEQEKELSKQLHEKISFVPKFNSMWYEFMKKGIEYNKQFNRTNDKCIFCGQSLDKESINNLNIINEFLSSQVVCEKLSVKNQIDNYKIESINLKLDKEKLLGKTQLIKYIEYTIKLINDNKELFNRNIEEKKNIGSSIRFNFEELIAKIDAELSSIKTSIENLDDYNKETDDKCKEIEGIRAILIKKERMQNIKKEFYRYYNLKNEIENLKKIGGKFSTNSLTKKEKEAFDCILKEDYIKTFKKFCDKLKVKNVEIKFNSSKGETYRNKYIVDECYKVTAIMSEGEQKAIAMAEFVTDLKLRNDCNTVCFDDPVTSLDYKRIEIFSQLIYEISKKRQVVVFTHNIMFYYYLYQKCSKDKNKENKFFKVDEYDYKTKGIISEEFSGRIENLSCITKKIKDNNNQIKSPRLTGQALEEKFKLVYSYIRTWCELIVEEGFFKGVISRYEPSIKFGRVSKISGDFIKELPFVEELFERCCRWMSGHSQPCETQAIKPNREIFAKDYEKIIELTKKYKIN